MNKINKLYQPNISELIDMFSIFLIKEVKDSKNKKYTKKKLKNIKIDLKNSLSIKKTYLNSKMIRKIILVGTINLLVWELKDNMLNNKKKYNSLLRKALELNTIRNLVFNRMLENFSEFEENRMRITKLGKIERNWHKFIIKKIKRI